MMEEGMNSFEFRQELQKLINKYNIENGSNTPDFLLADLLIDILVSFDKNVNRREEWYGRYDTLPKKIANTG